MNLEWFTSQFNFSIFVNRGRMLLSKSSRIRDVGIKSQWIENLKSSMAEKLTGAGACKVFVDFDKSCVVCLSVLFQQ